MTIILISVSAPVLAEEKPFLVDLSTITAQEGSFRQERWLSVLKEPLVSEGEFVIDPGASILWQLKTPFEMSYFFDGKSLTVTEDGESKLVTQKDEPLLYGFFSFFSKIFNLSYSEMTDWFDVSEAAVVAITENEEGHRIVLQPKKLFMKKSFEKAVIVESDGRIHSVSILESKGDKLHLTFTYHKK